MSLEYNTITINTVTYNGTTIDSLYYNDTLVYKRAASIKVVYGSNVSSVTVDGVAIANNGYFEYAPGDSKTIVVNYSGYVTGDGYVHSVNNNTTLNSTRWKYNTSYAIAGGLSKSVTVSSNLVAVSDTITFSLTDAEFASLSDASITFTAAKSGTQTYVSYTEYEDSVTFDFKFKVSVSGEVSDVTLNKTLRLGQSYTKYITVRYHGEHIAFFEDSNTYGGGFRVTSRIKQKIVGASGKVYFNDAGWSAKGVTCSYTAYKWQ